MEILKYKVTRKAIRRLIKDKNTFKDLLQAIGKVTNIKHLNLGLIGFNTQFLSLKCT